jgi:hypothetical protein
MQKNVWPNANERWLRKEEGAVRTGIRTQLLATAAITIMGIGAARAALTIQSSIGGAPNVAGVVRENFDGLLLGTSSPQTSLATGLTVILTPDAAITVGSAPGLYAAPFLSGGNGTGFGPGGTDQANGLDQTQYLTSGSTGAFANAAIDLVLPGSGGPYSYFGLLWGSVDLYNTLTFYDAADNVIGTVTGGQINPAATGDQGLNGTFYVNITSDTPFTRVRVTSSQ